MKQGSHIDFGKTAQIINVKLHQVSSLPAVWEGGFLYLTTDKTVYYGDGTAWIPVKSIAGLISSVTGGVGITVQVTNGVAKVTLVTDGTTLEPASASDGAAVRIMAGGVGTTQLADNSVTTIKVTDKNITFNKIQDIPTMTVVGRIAAGSGVSSAITILTDLSGIISAHDSLVSAKAVKDYVASVVGGLGTLEGAFDANAATNFPVGAGGTKKGAYWYVNVAGTVQGVALNIGDVLIANKVNASTTSAADWIFLETNRDQATTTTLGVIALSTQAEARAMSSTTKALTPSNLNDVRATNAETQTGTATDRFVTPASLSSRLATETNTGLIEIATQAEVNAGTDDTRAVTAAKLKVYTEGLLGSFGRFVADIGNGSATTFTVTHNLGTKNVHVEIWDNATWQTILCDVARTTTSAISVSFAAAPTSNEYKVFIMK
ncbi:MAG: hypothetical protein Q8J88_00885 [Bacteroidales bacterium]|nr:hypothetical protein [Bacteroidales bacterium]